MDDRAKNITIHIPAGVRRGIKSIEIMNWTGQVLICQREQIMQLENHWKEGIQRQGVYILFNRQEIDQKPDVYIGEAENVIGRLREHIRRKDFWERVLIFTNKDNNINKTHFKYLESRIVDLAKKSEEVNLTNLNVPQLPSLSRFDKDMMDEYLDHAIILLDTLGFSYLHPNEKRRFPDKKIEKSKNISRGSFQYSTEKPSTRVKIPSKERNKNTTKTSRTPPRIGLPKTKDILAAGLMKAGDEIWFKNRQLQKGFLTANGKCEYEGRQMSLREYGKIVSGWKEVNIYPFLIHGPSGKTIEDLRDRLVESNSDARPKSVSIERPPSDGKKARSIDSASGIRLYFDNPSIGVNAQGIYSSDGFLVLAGSTGPRETRQYFTPSNRARQKNLLDRGEIELRGDRLCFMQDIRFKSPTMAAEVISGGSQNGRIVWKDKDGKTLKEIQESSS